MANHDSLVASFPSMFLSRNTSFCLLFLHKKEESFLFRQQSQVQRLMAFLHLQQSTVLTGTSDHTETHIINMQSILYHNKDKLSL